MNRDKVITCTFCGTEGKIKEEFIRDSKKKRFTEATAVCDGCLEEAISRMR